LAPGGEEGRGQRRNAPGRSRLPAIRGCPNGGTRPPARAVTLSRGPTRGTETSQYPEERKSTETPRVAASESGRAQTAGCARRGCGTATKAAGGPAEAPGKARRRGQDPRTRRTEGAGRIPSRAGHVKPRSKQGGPPSKAKHYPETDSEPVP